MDGHVFGLHERSEIDGVVMIPKMPSGYTELPKVETYELLKGLKGANIVDGKTLTILGKDAECGGILTNGSVTWSKWDRKVTVSNLITGEGDLVVQNEVADNSMEVTIVGGNNTCTGEIRCDGENNAKILFADGANWAGTVVANAAVSFAGAEPAGDLPVRCIRGLHFTLNACGVPASSEGDCPSAHRILRRGYAP